MSAIVHGGGFCDLNASLLQSDVQKALERYVLFGYRIVALNQILDCTAIIKKKKKEKREDIVPEPVKINLPSEIDGKLKLINRLTVIYNDPTQLFQVTKSPNTRKYHLVGVIPENINCFQGACSSNDIDIIGFKPENRLDFKLHRKAYNMAVERNIYFELTYSPMIIDSTCRKNIIQVSQLYHTVGKSKNIIITSGATSFLQLRGPYDVSNLGLLLDLKEQQAKEALASTCHRLILKAESRRFGRPPILIERCESEEEDGASNDEEEMNENQVKENEEVSAKKIKLSEEEPTVNVSME